MFYGAGLIVAILFARIIKEGGGVSGARPSAAARRAMIDRGPSDTRQISLESGTT